MALRYRRYVPVVAAILVVLMAGIIWANSGNQFSISVDGTPIGYVENREIIETAVQTVLAEVSLELGQDAVAGEYSVDRVRVESGAAPLTLEELTQLLRQSLPILVRGAMITVNGEDVVGLKTSEEAHQVIEQIKEQYRLSAQKAAHGTELEELTIDEEITVSEKQFTFDKLKDVETAKYILLRGTDLVVEHTVKRGDSLWSIATRNNMSVKALQQANPGVDPNRLKPGQKLNLVQANPYVHVGSRGRRTFIQAIAYPVKTIEDPDRYVWQDPIVEQAGVQGKKEVVEEVIFRDGKIVERTVISQTILSEPTPAILRKGTKTAPDLGSGQFAWPVAGGGKITSKFGIRWGRMHSGVDIAAPRGTEVHAADSGTVTFVGWNGYYGKMIEIDHGSGKTVTIYGHLNGWAVKVGDTVKKGDLIGYVGSTGRSTGNHLHFEIRIDGKAQNPLKFYPSN